MEIQNLYGGRRRERAADLLERVGLDASDLERYPHEFSGGPAPAHRYRPGAGRGPGVHCRRRTGFRPGCVDPVPGPQPVQGSAGGVAPDLSLYFARLERGAVHQRPGGHRVHGQDRGDGPGRYLSAAPIDTHTPGTCSRRSLTRIPRSSRTSRIIRWRERLRAPSTRLRAAGFTRAARLRADDCRREMPPLEEIVAVSGHWVACWRVQPS